MTCASGRIADEVQQITSHQSPGQKWQICIISSPSRRNAGEHPYFSQPRDTILTRVVGERYTSHPDKMTRLGPLGLASAMCQCKMPAHACVWSVSSSHWQRIRHLPCVSPQKLLHTTHRSPSASSPCAVKLLRDAVMQAAQSYLCMRLSFALLAQLSFLFLDRLLCMSGTPRQRDSGFQEKESKRHRHLHHL